MVNDDVSRGESYAMLIAVSRSVPPRPNHVSATHTSGRARRTSRRRRAARACGLRLRTLQPLHTTVDTWAVRSSILSVHPPPTDPASQKSAFPTRGFRPTDLAWAHRMGPWSPTDRPAAP